MPVAPAGGQSTQLAEPDDTAPTDEPVELRPPVPRPVADDRPEATPPAPEPAAEPVPALLPVPVPVVVLPVELVVVALVPLAGVAFEVVVAVLVVGPVLVAAPDPTRDGRTTALPLREALPTLLPVAVCAAAGTMPRASSVSAKPALRTMPGQAGPLGCRPYFAALLGFSRIRPVRKQSR